MTTNMDRMIKVRSAHCSDAILTIDLTGVEKHPTYEELMAQCQEFFGFEGYLTVSWAGGYKICSKKFQFLGVSKYIYNSDTVFFVRQDCCSKTKKN